MNKTMLFTKFSLYLLIGVVILLLFANTALATTYYISTTGSDDRSGISESQAWASFSHAISRINAGDVLIILDGTYHQSLSISKSGTSFSPITIRALNDGKVVIDGEHSRRPIRITGDYIIIEGIHARNSNDDVITINGGDHNILRRLIRI